MSVRFNAYRGVTVHVDGGGRFIVPEVKGVPPSCEGLEAESYEEICCKIEVKLKAKFQRVKVWSGGRWRGNDYRLVTVTSVTGDEEKWTIDAKGQREKLTSHDVVYLDTPENAKLIESITEHRNQIGVWETRVAALTDTLAEWEPPED